MKNQQSLLNALEGWAQEELAGQRRMIATLQRQEDALVANRSGELLSACQEMDTELQGQSERNRRRERLFRDFGELFSVDAKALSMSSILERCSHPARLIALREELRRSTAQIVRRNRRFAALAGAQRKLIDELVAELLQQEDPKQLNQGGSLINAKA